jgi:soluble lytic murein transglycosylase-like protein
MRPLCTTGVLALAAALAAQDLRAGEIVVRREADGVLSVSNLAEPLAPPRPRRSREATGEPAAKASPRPRPPFAELVNEVALRYDLDPDLIHAVIAAESNYNPRAVSRKGAIGLMQVMPATGRSLGVTDLIDPHQNVVAGARHLRRLLDHYDGDVTLAVAAYNAGQGAVDQHGGIPPYPETMAYVRRVRGRYPRSGRAAEPAARGTIHRYLDDRGIVVYTQFPAGPAAR